MNRNIFHYLLSGIIVGSIALLSTPLANTQNYHVVSFILLFAVSILSTFMSIGPVIFTSSISAIVWNYFFIPPHYTFHIEKTEDILIFGLFFIIALVNGILTARIRRQEQITREKEKRTNALFELTKELSKKNSLDELIETSVNKITEIFSVHAFIILQDGSGKLIKDAFNETLAAKDVEIAQWSFENVKKAGKFTNINSDREYSFFPLVGTKINPGVLVISHEIPVASEAQFYWNTYIAQISNALEREFLGKLAQKAQFLHESDRLYKTLFNSISHELRIPIATIMGASDSILHSHNNKEILLALSQEIFTASQRLNRLIENLLNMSRLESGHISVRLDWYDIHDLVHKVVSDLEDELQHFHLNISIPDDLPLVRIDFGLMEQVLYNLLFNSTQYTPEQSEISIHISVTNNAVIQITDNGPGFPEEELESVFKKFFKVNTKKTGGLGLGLSIAKGFVEAHNGNITVQNGAQNGAIFTITIPTEKPNIDFNNEI
jgi:two-component system sensor histidine kinase KdpD